MSDIFNYWQPTVFVPPPYWAGPDPYAASNANMAANIAAQQSNQALVNQGGYAGQAMQNFNPATSPNTAPSGMTYPGAGMVQSYPSFGEAQNYGGQNDPFSGGYSPYQQPAQPPSGTTPVFSGGEWRSMQDLTPEQQYQWSQLNGVPYSPLEQYNNGGYDPFSSQTYQPAAQPNVGSGWPTAAIQPQEPAYQPYTNPYTGYPFNEAYPPGQDFAPQGSPSYQWPPEAPQSSWRPAPGSWQERLLGPNWTPEGPSSYSGGYDPFNSQTYQPAAQPNVGSGWPTAAVQPQEPAYQPYTNPYTGNPFNEAYPIGNLTPQSSPSYQWPPGGYNYPSDLQSMTPEQQYQWSQLNGIPLPSFNDRSGPPQLPDVINNGGYPTLDQRWSPLNEPYYNQPLNDALWQRGSGAQSGPQVEPNRFTPPPELPLPPDSEIWTPVPGSWQEKLLGPGPRTSAGPLNSMAQMPQRDAIAQAIVEQPPSMADFQSPANNYDTFQQPSSTPSWQRAIPQERSSPELINEINSLSQQYGWSPAAMAAVMQMESTFNPLQATGSYRGLTQMGPDTFREAGGTLNGLTFEQYQRATPAQQARTYGAWIDHYAKNDPNNAASLVKGGIGSLPPEMQAAIMQATQFGPNSIDWVKALAEGNMSVPTTPYPQADALKPYTIEAMRNEFERRMQGW